MITIQPGMRPFTKPFKMQFVAKIGPANDPILDEQLLYEVDGDTKQECFEQADRWFAGLKIIYRCEITRLACGRVYP